MQQDPFIGKALDGFTVEERIGRGGMATVYRAMQASVHRSVALKVIRLDETPSEDSEFARRFAQEAEVVAALEHIHILPIIDYGIEGDVAYIAMRLLRGGSLAERLRNGPLDFYLGGEIFAQVARGLAYAHHRGVIHRDLKPSNILFDDTGNAYLTDFGLAKLIESSVHLTRDGHVVGTPAYMSPEQLRGDSVDQRSDIYSMGVILYHMVVGRPPFDSSDGNMVTTMYGHLEKAPVPPREINPSVPAAIEEVILKALQKRPADRFPTIEAMTHALQSALGIPADPTTPRAVDVLPATVEVAAMATPPVSRPPQTASTLASPVPTGRSRMRVAWIAGLLVLVAISLVLLILNLLPREGSPTPSTAAPSTVIALRPTIAPGAVGSAADAVPSTQEIALAEARMGEDGFIANIACTQDSEYHATQAREMRDLAARYGLELRVYDSALDEYRQLTLVEQARTAGARALIVCPLDIDLLRGPLTAAQEAGIPIAFLAAGIPSYGGVLLSGDDHEMGLRAGQAGGALINALFDGLGRVLVLDFPEMAIIVERVRGLEEGMLDIAPDSIIVDHRLGGTRENGYASVKSALEEGLDFNTILSLNDAGSFGAIQALEEAGISPEDVVISSVDAEALALEYIRDGHYLRASVSVGRALFSQAAINATVRMLAGAALPETLLVPPGDVITAENVDTAE